MEEIRMAMFALEFSITWIEDYPMRHFPGWELAIVDMKHALKVLQTAITKDAAIEAVKSLMPGKWTEMIYSSDVIDAITNL